MSSTKEMTKEMLQHEKSHKSKRKIRISRLSETDDRRKRVPAFKRAVERLIRLRIIHRLIIEDDDLTPDLMRANSEFRVLAHNLDRDVGVYYDEDEEAEAIKEIGIWATAGFTGGTMELGEDLESHISISYESEHVPIWKRKYSDTPVIEKKVEKPKKQEYLKVTLRETDDFLLFEKSSLTVPRHSEEAEVVEEDNARYEFLTTGPGKIRRKNEAETQTNDVLYKTRHINTDVIPRVDVGTYVSFFDMFDTYKHLERKTTSIALGDETKLNITTYSNIASSFSEMQPDSDEKIEITDEKSKNFFDEPSFRLAITYLQRTLAGNVFHEEQKRFRNMVMPDPLALDIKYLYNLKTLWIHHAPSGEKKAPVSSICWCPTNGDILAVGYGIYAYLQTKDVGEGIVCVWSIKNPVNPERIYKYPVPVTSVEFCTEFPQVLAIGLHDGTVELRDISSDVGGYVAKNNRNTLKINEPILGLKWCESNRLLACSQEGLVVRLSMGVGPNLYNFLQMKLNRIVGSAEGIKIKRKDRFIEANRNPRCTALALQPENNIVFYVLTDEGCYFKCSLNSPEQYITVRQVHDGCAFGLDFSPWSPKLFLTHGSDWYIRIWIEGIFDPIIQLSSGIGAIHSAFWSPVHSTIIVSVTRCAVEIWDIRRSILKPISSHNLGDASVHLTTAKFSNCGRSIAVGNENGDVYVCAFEDMPFPPYFQYDELEMAILNAIRAFPDLTRQVKSFDFLGYPGKIKITEMKEDGVLKE